MLQQTQVETVRPYFERFIAALPNVAALAQAQPEEVLRLWEGLGYYRRARQLHAAAQKIASELEGVFPQSVTALQQLPGVGRYTAGAIASIAFGQQAPILEANTIRLLSRVLGYRKDPAKTAGQKLLWGIAAEILPRKNVAEFNQALMELGSLVCAPQNPGCNECPVRELCPTQQHGLQEVIPVSTRKPVIQAIREAAVIVQNKSRVLLRRCSDQERWAGLWDFPRFEIRQRRGRPLEKELQENVFQLTGVQICPPSRLHVMKHSVTRYRITLSCYRSELESIHRSKEKPAARVKWVRIADLENYPLSVTGRKMCRWLPLQ